MGIVLSVFCRRLLRCLIFFLHFNPTTFGTAKYFNVKPEMSSLFSCRTDDDDDNDDKQRHTHSTRVRTTYIGIVQCKESWYCSLFSFQNENNTNEKKLKKKQLAIIIVISLWMFCNCRRNPILHFLMHTKEEVETVLCVLLWVIWDSAYSAPHPISAVWLMVNSVTQK